MIFIQKSPAPISLSQYKNECKREMTLGYTNLLDDYPEKDALRQQLAVEQGYLCAYCMRRISLDFQATVIEHVRPQATYPKEQLEYGNLVLCCDGKENDIDKQNHCDGSKKNSEIKYSPATVPYIETTIRYERNGRIFSNDSQWNSDLDTVLNLNVKRICNNRKAAWAAVQDWLAHNPGQRTRSEIEARLILLRSRNHENKMIEYCGVMAYVLKRHPSFQSA